MANQAHKGKKIARRANQASRQWPTSDLGVGSAIFILAFAIRLLYLFQVESIPVFYNLPGDPRTYDEWAQRIVAGDWIGHGVFYQAPLYPYFLASLQFFLGHDLWSIRVVQLMLGAGACSLLYFAGAALFSRNAGIAAALLLSLNAPAIFFAAVVDKTAIDLFLVAVLLVLLSVRASPHERLAWLATGMVLGLLGLSRENALIWALLIPPWIWFQYAVKSRQERLMTLAMFMLGLTLILLPVGIRNLVVGGQFTLTTSQMGANFFIGNNPNADGTYGSIRRETGDKQFEGEEATRLAEEAAGRALKPGEVSSYWLARSWDYIRSQPEDWIRLLGKKWMIVWNTREIEDSDDYYLYQKWSWLLTGLAWINHFGILAPLAAVGVLLTVGQWRRLWLFYAMIILFALSVAVFYVFGRYRFPLVPLLALFAGAGVDEGFASVKAVEPRRLAGCIAVFAIVWVFVQWPVAGAAGPSAVGFNILANAYDKQGKVDEAIENIRQALKIDPSFGVAHYNLANFYVEKRQLDDAIEHYREAIKAYPRYVAARGNLGNVLAMKGRLDDAATQYSEALKLAPGEVRLRLAAGEVAVLRDRLDEARGHFEQVVKVNPDFALAQFELGNVLAAQGDLDGAIIHFRAAIHAEPQLADPYSGLARALASQGKRAEAEQNYQQALKLLRAQRASGRQG